MESDFNPQDLSYAAGMCGADKETRTEKRDAGKVVEEQQQDLTFFLFLALLCLLLLLLLRFRFCRIVELRTPTHWIRVKNYRLG